MKRKKKNLNCGCKCNVNVHCGCYSCDSWLYMSWPDREQNFKMNDCSSQFLTHQAAVCSGNYPAYFGEGTKLTVLGKITAITINTWTHPLH